ncbi:MAG: beta-N-acetylhexosaminidase [Rickettsiales bacterium]
MHVKPLIFGISGKALTEAETEFLQLYNPLGVILFSRNIDNPEQVQNLTASIREVLGRQDAPILLDQEGGRVSRLKEPHWIKPPAAAIFGKMAEVNLDDALKAAFLHGRIIGYDMAAVGFNVDCAPVLDVPVSGAHDVIGNRAFSHNKELVLKLGQAMADGLSASQVAPIMKHIPGHGRAMVDSHHELPKVTASLAELRASDFYPFQNARNIYWAMTAHVVYEAIDPKNPATTSATVVDLLRDEIGFEGLLISDCITMKALNGTMVEKASRSFEAGVDLVIHSHGPLNEMAEVAKSSPDMTEDQLTLLAKSFDSLKELEHKFQPRSEMHARLINLIDSYNLSEVSGNIFDPTEQNT